MVGMGQKDSYVGYVTFAPAPIHRDRLTLAVSVMRPSPSVVS